MIYTRRWSSDSCEFGGGDKLDMEVKHRVVTVLSMWDMNWILLEVCERV